MRKFLYFLNGIGFIGTLLILLALVETHTIREWVFEFITINLAVYMYSVRKLRRKLADYERYNGDDGVFTVKESGLYRISYSIKIGTKGTPNGE
jgi:hypothetical protein